MNLNSFEKNKQETPHNKQEEVQNKNPDSKTNLVVDKEGNIVTLEQILSGENQ